MVNFSLDFEDAYIDSFQGKPIWPVPYFGLYATAYYGSVWLWTYFHRRPDIWRNRQFWLRSGTALVCYSSYAGFYAHSNWSRQLFDGQIYVFAYYCLHNLQSLLTIVLPLYVFYKVADPYSSQFYGMVPKRKGLVLYGLLLALMIPLITLASFQPDFLQSYPTYHDTNANEFFGVPEWVTALIYELCYGWDFLPTELLFRGFLVIGMSRVLGAGGRVADGCVVLFHSLWPTVGRSYFFSVWRLFAGCAGPKHPQHLGRLTYSHRHCLGYGDCCFLAGCSTSVEKLLTHNLAVFYFI